MNSFEIALISFACMAMGSGIGWFVRRRLPGVHLASDSRDVVKLGAGLIATQAALVVGLLVSSSKGSFDSTNAGLTQIGAKVILLDHVLGRYGPEAGETRRNLRTTLSNGIDRIWPKHGTSAGGVSAAENSTEWAAIDDSIHRLSPQNETQAQLRTQAIQIISDLAQLRLVLLEQTHGSLPPVFLVVLIFWFTVLFTVFALLTQFNPTVAAVLIVCAASISGAIFLICEMSHPLQGAVQASAAPLEAARDRIGR